MVTEKQMVIQYVPKVGAIIVDESLCLSSIYLRMSIIGNLQITDLDVNNRQHVEQFSGSKLGA